MAIAQRFIREASTGSVPDYRKHVYRLATIYLLIVLVATAAIVLIVVRGKFFVTLAQRSNVETLTLAFILILFAYLAIASLPGAWGMLVILYYNLPARFGRDRAAVEQRKQATVKFNQDKPDTVYLNCRVCLQDHPDEPISVPLEDDAGSLGTILIEGARLSHEHGAQHCSNSLFGFFQQRIEQLVNERDPRARVEIVQWATINDEAALQYDSVVTFSRRLEKHLGAEPLWPVVELTAQDVATLIREGTELCPTLRDESHLPDLEYEVQHQLPIIPEPLALLSLSRQEQRADPEATMGCALLVTVGIVALLVLFIYFPPWVPGK